MEQILITDGTNFQLKSKATDSITVHLPTTCYINVVLANGNVLCIDNNVIGKYDTSDTLIHSIPL